MRPRRPCDSCVPLDGDCEPRISALRMSRIPLRPSATAFRVARMSAVRALLSPPEIPGDKEFSAHASPLCSPPHPRLSHFCFDFLITAVDKQSWRGLVQSLAQHSPRTSAAIDRRSCLPASRKPCQRPNDRPESVYEKDRVLQIAWTPLRPFPRASDATISISYD